MNFTYNPKYGIFSDKFKLIPAPNYILRRSAIIDVAKKMKVGNFLEIGFGSGVCTYDFFRLGFDCTGYDIEDKSVEFANNLFNSEKHIIDFRNYLDDNDLERYDYLGAFEVLEHIENDTAIISDWKNYIRPGGYLLLSVPAKMKSFSYLDKVSGHIRRYEKNDIVTLLEKNGFKVELLFNYGFPFSNIFSPIFNLFYRKKQYRQIRHLSDLEKTKESGRLRLSDYKFRNFIPYKIIYTFCIIQRLFYKLDLGLGYVVLSKKVNL